MEEPGLITLKERRHQADMLPVYKITTGKDNVQSESWFRMAAGGAARTRQAIGLLNIVKPKPALGVQSNFFSVRTAEWNLVLAQG